MKRIIAILVLINVCVYGQKTVNVIAKNGLNLRKTPNENGSLVATIPFGTDLTVLENTQISCKPILVFKKDTLNIDENNNNVDNDLSLTGIFLKVIYKGRVGYINSLYTCSAIPNLAYLDQKRMGGAILDEFDNIGEINFHLLNAYFKEKKQSKRELQYQEKIDENKNQSVFFIKEYPNGLQYKFMSDFTDIGSGGYSFELSSKNLTFNEAVMMARLLFDDISQYNIGFACQSVENKYELYYYSEGSFSYASIYKNKQGYWTLEYGSGSC